MDDDNIRPTVGKTCEKYTTPKEIAMDDDYTDPVCCETPMLCMEDRDADGRSYVYYVCLQCGCETDEVAVDVYQDWMRDAA